jgi:hypothetical protein
MNTIDRADWFVRVSILSSFNSYFPHNNKRRFKKKSFTEGITNNYFSLFSIKNYPLDNFTQKIIIFHNPSFIKWWINFI